MSAIQDAHDRAIGIDPAGPANSVRDKRWQSLARLPATILLAVLSFTPLLSALADAGPSLPNIVLILSDDQHWRDYSYTGENPFVRTPHIDELAKDGVLIQRTYVPTSICRPSLANLFTGLHSAETGITGNAPAPSGNGPRDRRANHMLRRSVEFHATLPRLLRERGYRSLQTGKWWEGDARRAGFDAGTTRDRSRMLGQPARRSIGRAGIGPIEEFVRKANEDGVPFFVSYAPLLPHHPHSPPGRFRTHYAPFVASGQLTQNQALYYATIEWFDATIGELRNFLRTTKRADGSSIEDHTLYVYTVDNGWTQPLTGPPSALGSAAGKITPREGGVRVPLILYWKGEIIDSRSIAAKLTDTRLASTLDILPTLLSAAAASDLRPDLAQGIDLLNESREEIFGATYEHDIPVTAEGPIRFASPETSRTSRWMIQDRWKLIVADRAGANETTRLYDLIADPDEAHDLASSSSDRTAAMTARLEQWWSQSRPVTEYAHEFAADEKPLDGVAPDLAGDHGDARWIARGGALQDGTVPLGSSAVLPWRPREGQRYELRVAGNGLVFGFLSGLPDPTFDAAAVASGRALPIPVSQIVFQVRDPVGGEDVSERISVHNPLRTAATLVLETTDGDPSRPGNQWTLSLLVGGIPRATHVYRHGNPAIRYIGVGCASATTGSIEAIQLVQTPRSISRASQRLD